MGLLNKRTILLAVVLFFISIQLFSNKLERNKMRDPLSEVVLTITYYPQMFVHYVTGEAVGVWNRYVALYKVNNENEMLRMEINKLKEEKHHLLEAKLQNSRLKQLLELKSNTSYPVVAANVIGGSPSSIRNEVVIIDKGKNEGIEVGMPVAINNGIVGRVLLASDKSSEVMLITDPISSIDAYVLRNRARGIVKGGGEDCVMEYIESLSDVEVGDLIISSGKDGFYPKGVTVGKVTEVKSDGGLVKALLEPQVNLNSLEEVVVILKSNSIVLNE